MQVPVRSPGTHSVPPWRIWQGRGAAGGTPAQPGQPSASGRGASAGRRAHLCRARPPDAALCSAADLPAEPGPAVAELQRPPCCSRAAAGLGPGAGPCPSGEPRGDGRHCAPPAGHRHPAQLPAQRGPGDVHAPEPLPCLPSDAPALPVPGGCVWQSPGSAGLRGGHAGGPLRVFRASCPPTAVPGSAKRPRSVRLWALVCGVSGTEEAGPYGAGRGARTFVSRSFPASRGRHRGSLPAHA